MGCRPCACPTRCTEPASSPSSRREMSRSVVPTAPSTPRQISIAGRWMVSSSKPRSRSCARIRRRGVTAKPSSTTWPTTTANRSRTTGSTRPTKCSPTTSSNRSTRGPCRRTCGSCRHGRRCAPRHRTRSVARTTSPSVTHSRRICRGTTTSRGLTSPTCSTSTRCRGSTTSSPGISPTAMTPTP